MNKHFEIICAWCKVLEMRENAIWYEDGGYRYADIFEPGEGWCSYSCNSREMWEMLCDLA